MKNKDIKKDNREIVSYLNKNNLALTSKTMKVLSDSLQNLGLDKKYYDILKLQPRIANFFLQNSILWNDTAYSAIMALASDYDEDTVLKYMQLGLYEPLYFWEFLKDNRIPKLDKTNYYKLISKQPQEKDQTLIYEAFLLPLLRHDNFYVNQVKNLNQDNNRQALVNELNSLKAITEEKEKIYGSKIREKLASLSQRNVAVAQDFFNVLFYYNDFSSLNFFTNVEDFKPYLSIMKIVAKVRNVDEYQVVRSYMIRIINYLNQRENIINEFQFDCIIYDENAIPANIAKEQDILFKKGYANLYAILENLNQEFTLKKEKPLTLTKIRNKK